MVYVPVAKEDFRRKAKNDKNNTLFLNFIPLINLQFVFEKKLIDFLSISILYKDFIGRDYIIVETNLAQCFCVSLLQILKATDPLSPLPMLLSLPSVKRNLS